MLICLLLSVMLLFLLCRKGDRDTGIFTGGTVDMEGYLVIIMDTETLYDTGQAEMVFDFFLGYPVSTNSFSELMLFLLRDPVSRVK